MKNLLLILLLANILYFLWGLFSTEELRPGVAIIDESELGPPLPTAQEIPEEPEASVGAVLGSGEPADLVAVVGKSCVSIGPFRDSNDADSAETRYKADGMRTARRSGQGDIFVGHWVQIRNVPSREESRRMIEMLTEAGLSDAYPVETEDEGLKISLGVFGNADSAQQIERDARALGLPAEISPRTAEAMVYWVDVELPQGKGAGEIVERYGEEQVLMRTQATCP